jgi:putative membrane protein
MMDGWDTSMGVLGWTLMVILWIALVALIGVAIARLMPTSTRSAPEAEGEGHPSPERLLDERLARGEIDLETYERLREALARRGGTGQAQ